MTLTRRHALLGTAGLGMTAFPGAGLTSMDMDPSIRAAMLFAFPIFEVARTAAGPGPNPAPDRYNRINHRRALIDPSSRSVTTPNNDTLYSSARIDLSGGPVDVSIPDVPTSRYFVVAFMDAQGDNFAYVGTRATGGMGGDFRLVRRDRPDRIPPGVTAISSDSNDVWMLVRWLVADESDLPIVHALQDQMTVTPAPGNGQIRLRQTVPTSALDPTNLIAVVRETLLRSSADQRLLERAARFSSVGLTDLGDRPPDGALIDRWTVEAPRTLAALAAGLGAGGKLDKGWRYPSQMVGSRESSDELRSHVALTGLAALETAEAMYVNTVSDSDGNALTGSACYRLAIPSSGVPVDAFWSLTMYALEADGRMFLAANSINRFAVGDRSRVWRDSLGPERTIALQYAPPVDPTVIWLPTPRGSWRAVLRAYLPSPALLSGDWCVPAITRVV